MKLLETIGNKAIKIGGKVSNYSPEILIGSGIVFGGITVYLACKGTLKLDETLDDCKDDISEAKKSGEKKELTKAYAGSAMKIARVYSPAVATGTLSIACVLTGHHILRKRELAAAAAYKVLDDSFKSYKKRVAEKYGEEIEKKIRYGVEEKEFEVEEETKDGKKKTKKVKKEVVENYGYSNYARFFDECSPDYSDNPELNLYFLKQQQNYANDLLRARGHVFLNEVYDMLGIPRSEAGCVVGWSLKGDGDGYIDFGIYDANREANRDFVNGYESVILLDFNVDGIISNKL